MNFTAWITLQRDGIPRRLDIWADDAGHARELAAARFPGQSVAIAVRQS